MVVLGGTSSPPVWNKGSRSARTCSTHFARVGHCRDWARGGRGLSTAFSEPAVLLHSVSLRLVCFFFRPPLSSRRRPNDVPRLRSDDTAEGHRFAASGVRSPRHEGT